MLKYLKTYSDFLNESLKTARELYLNTDKIPNDVFSSLVEIDPTNTKKYLNQLCRFYLQGASVSKLKDLISQYDMGISKGTIDKKDIGTFKNFEEFENITNSSKGKLSKTDEERLKKTKGSEVILDTDDLLILYIKDKDASIEYGKGTKWCISATDSENYFETYEGRLVTFYFIFQKKLKDTNPLYKIAVAVYPEGWKEIFNAKDKSIKYDVVCKLVKNCDEIFVSKVTNEQIIKKHIIGTFDIDSNGLMNVKGGVHISDMNLNTLMDFFKMFNIEAKGFGDVTGTFNCSFNNLRTLEGSPLKVGDYFNCNHNNLITLEGGPREVGSDFWCSANKVSFTEKDVKKVCNVKNNIYV